VAADLDWGIIRTCTLSHDETIMSMDSSTVNLFKLESDLDILPTATSPQGSQHHRTLLAKSTVQSFPWKSSTVIFICSTTISTFVVVLALKLNALSQSSTNRIVDVDNCTCDCWDRAFKVREVRLHSVTIGFSTGLLFFFGEREDTTQEGISICIFK
jgi:hypothetical protein